MASIAKYVEEANRFFNGVAQALHTPDDIGHAHRVSTAVLHALRERISPEESLHLISCLPMILKGIYVDGWKISKTSYQSDTLEDFLQLVREHAPTVAGRDFGNDRVTRDHVKAVLDVMKRYVPQGEFKDIREQLPESLAALIG